MSAFGEASTVNRDLNTPRMPLTPRQFELELASKET